MTVNQTVITPLGKGVVQGRTDTGLLVRLPVNDATRPHLGASWTPRARISGLWVFAIEEMESVQ